MATAVLWEHGTCGIEVRAGEPGEAVLVAYFEDPQGTVEAELRRSLSGLAAARLERIAVPNVDWVARFRKGFRGFDAGGFRIAPCWDVPSRSERRVLIVEPGRAFGTGTHESTRLCLDALAELCRNRCPAEVLDVGTGSGILAVAAALHGAKRVAAVDFDPEALACARRHAALNRVELRLVRGDGACAFGAGRFDLVLANLSLPLLLRRGEELASVRKPMGAMVLAGFLAEDVEALAAAYEPAGRLDVRRDGDWAALLVRGGGRQP